MHATYLLGSLLPNLVASLANRKAIDLTHSVGEHTIAWPSATKFSTSNVVRMQVDVVGSGGYWYEARDISQAEHSGTHTDAPAHFYKGGWRTADIPLERLAGPGVKIDITEKVKKDQDTGLAVDDILAWEEEHGEIPEDAVVIVHTGHGKWYGDKKKYFGRPEGLDLPDNDTQHLHFPGVEPEASQWLVDKRKIVGLGIDTPSTDKGQSRQFRTHRILGQANIWGLENMARTEELPSKGFMVYNMVHKLEGGSGGPTRVVAILDSAASNAGNVVPQLWRKVLASLLVMQLCVAL